jgi:hypothetical protein
MGWFGKKLTDELDLVVDEIAALGRNILSETLRRNFIEDLGFLCRTRAASYTGNPAKLLELLGSVHAGMRPDEFNTQKVNALNFALTLLRSGAVTDEAFERARQMMLSAGLLGHSYSGGVRKTVDGKY